MANISNLKIFRLSKAKFNTLISEGQITLPDGTVHTYSPDCQYFVEEEILPVTNFTAVMADGTTKTLSINAELN